MVFHNHTRVHIHVCLVLCCYVGCIDCILYNRYLFVIAERYWQSIENLEMDQCYQFIKLVTYTLFAVQVNSISRPRIMKTPVLTRSLQFNGLECLPVYDRKTLLQGDIYCHCSF